MPQLRIAINGQLVPGTGAGGIESVLVGLVSALGQLQDGPEEYVIIGPWQDPDWIKPYTGPNQRLVVGPQPRRALSIWRKGIKRCLEPLRPAARQLARWAFPSLPTEPEQAWLPVPISNGFYERLGCNVIHFPFQEFVLCALPAIYNPHDLQHLHYPQFFTPSTIAWRETVYPAGCHLAHTIVVGSRWVKQDVVRHYRADPDKIQIIPWAPPTLAYPTPSPETLNSVRIKHQLHLPFAFYPAATWEHKNHLRLLEALACLRDRDGLVVHLVCSGNRYSGYWPKIEEQLQSLHLADQVRFLGMVPPEELRVLYRLAQFVFVPTLFEAASGPVFEAWQDGTPVACSTVTSLPEQAGDAALLFEPFSVEAIADAMRRMATDEQLRVELVRKGNRRLQDFDWGRTAKAYRAVYRRAAQYPLSDEDRHLLSWDWMQNSEPGEAKS